MDFVEFGSTRYTPSIRELRREVCASRENYAMLALLAASTAQFTFRSALEGEWELERTKQGAIVRARYSLRGDCLLYTSPSPRDQRGSRMPSSA